MADTAVGHVWAHHSSIPLSTRRLRFSGTASGWWKGALPADALQASVHHKRSHAITLEGVGSSTSPLVRPQPSLLASWERMEKQCDDFYGWVPDKIQIHGDKWALVEL